MNICDLNFSNSFTRTLPGDDSGNTSARQTLGLSWAKTIPRTPTSPEVLLHSPECARLLELSPDFISDSHNVAILSGREVCKKMYPFSARYGGHQFGNWAGQLGDGRAITLGEVLTSANERFEIQLKGAGQSAYSRRGDGLAVLRSSLREFLCSEAMHHLGVPTTRALSLSLTGDQVLRDMFYDGNPEWEDGAVTARVAQSFIRFGHFQIYAASGEKAELEKFLNYVLQTHFPEFSHNSLEQNALDFFSHVCTQTANMIAQWMRVGFVHGVMNTDNMSIHGLTIDYGPYGWMDVYDPDWTPNTTDAQNRRYRFGAQPSVANWNLARLAEALMSLGGPSSNWEEALACYAKTFNREIISVMREKLGLFISSDDEVMTLAKDLESFMSSHETDFTIFYRELSRESFQKKIQTSNKLDDLIDDLNVSFYQKNLDATNRSIIKQWLSRYQEVLKGEQLCTRDRSARMSLSNPYFILRNYLVVSALESFEKGDRSMAINLMAALKNPYEENSVTSPFYALRPVWARHRAGASALSCSS